MYSLIICFTARLLPPNICFIEKTEIYCNIVYIVISPDQVDEKGKLDDTPVSTTTDNGHGDVVKTTKPDEEEVLLPPGDIQKNTEEIPKRYRTLKS